jgi:hypothetical protein
MYPILSQDNGHPDQESRTIEEKSEGWEYIADVRAWETVSNILRGYGVSLREGGGRTVTFSSQKRINMKGLKERRLLWSYSVAKVKRIKELVEVG